ncbi:MAG: MFS transporter [Deltaproteobacteria bacterium]|nr:MFS transporter [Deltaproteobacteria bacterium]
MQSKTELRSIMAWAFYDWANSAFATTVMAGFFPLFFKEYWGTGTDVTLTTFKLGAANSIAGIAIAFCAPFLGAMADIGGYRKPFLLAFALLGIVSTGSLYVVTKGDWQSAAFLYVLGVIGFSGGNVFYDSLLVNVAPEEKWDTVSALGYAMGYLGGGLLFSLNVLMTLYPSLFGLSGASHAVRISFLSVALWWALFSLPLMFFVRGKLNASGVTGKKVMREGVLQVLNTFSQVRRLRIVFLFLLAYWLYIDGVDTIIRMAVDYGISLGLESRSLILALLLTQFVGFPAAILFGRLGARMGARKGIFIALGVYLSVTLWGYFLDSEAEFFVLAGIIGLVQGGVQSLSRSLYARIIPPRLSAEFFGFYNLLGKFAAVLGPMVMGFVSWKTGNPRFSILAIAGFFILGASVLLMVDEEEGRRTALALENERDPSPLALG